jgi:hypothetical protein
VALRRRAGSLLVVAFAVLLLLPWVLGSGGEAENRAVQGMPPVNRDTVLDERTYRSVDGALRDRLSLRGDVIKAVAAAGYDTAGISLNTRVHAGPDGQLFFTSDFTRPCQEKLDVNRVAEYLRLLSGLRDDRPGSVTLVVAPDKSTVLRDRLGPLGDRLMRCSDRQRARIERLGAAEPQRVVDLVPRALAMRAAEPDAELYTPIDTHWTPHLARVYGTALIPRLARQTGATGVEWVEPEPKGTVQYGDLLGLLGLSGRTEKRDGLAGRPALPITRTEIPIRGGRPVWTTETSGAPVIQGHTLVVYDSFTAARGFANEFSVPQLIPYFGTATWVHWFDLKGLIDSGRLPKVDRIVFESVQREIGGVTAAIMFDPKVDAALREAMTPGPATTP